jgi:O-antigen/teichoic acid export membrane protein
MVSGAKLFVLPRLWRAIIARRSFRVRPSGRHRSGTRLAALPRFDPASTRNRSPDAALRKKKCSRCERRFYLPTRYHRIFNLRHVFRRSIRDMDPRSPERRSYSATVIDAGDEPVRSRESSRSPHSDMTAVARSGVVKLLGGLTNGVLGLILIILVTRGVGARGAGAFFESIGIFAIATNLCELGADTGLLRAIPRYRALGRTRDLRKLVTFALVPVFLIGSGISGLLIGMAPRLSDLVTHGRAGHAVTPFVRTLAFFVPLSSASTVLLAAAIGFGTVVPLLIVDNVGKPALRALAVGAVIAAGIGRLGLALAWALPIIPGLLVAAWFLRWLVRRAESRDRTHDDSPHARARMALEFWRFSAPVAIGSFFATVTSWIDTLLIGTFLSVGPAGVYTSAIRMMMVGLYLVSTVILVVSPHISRFLASGQRDRARSMYQISTAWLVLATWPVFLTIAFFAPVLVRVFGPGFATGRGVLVVASLAGLGASATGPVNAVLLMGGRSGWNLVNVTVGFSVNIVLNLLLIPRIGILGAGVAWATSLLVLNVSALGEVTALLHLHPFSAAFGVAAATSLVCYGGAGLVSTMVVEPSIASLVVSGTGATALYVLLLWRMRTILRLAELADVLRSRVHGGVRTGFHHAAAHRRGSRASR